MSKWRKTCETARLDRTLRGIAAAIVTANRAGTPDRVAYLAFRDRAAELGLTVPNAAYWSLLIGAVISLYQSP